MYYTNSMENKVVKRIFVDMDGVVADFLAGCSEMLGKPLTSDDAGHSEYDLRKEELTCLLYTSPSPRDKRQSRMPSSA